MLKDVCDGMHFMETNHWVHGDLATRNLLIGDKGTVKVCDFGHAVQTNSVNDPVQFTQQLPIKWLVQV
jgi:serine/threonine protein kinase